MRVSGTRGLLVVLAKSCVSLTGAADSVDARVREVGDETGTGFNLSAEHIRDLCRQTDHRAAALAPEVQMRRAVCRVIGRCSRFNMRVSDKPDLLEYLKHPIDGRKAHVVALLADVGMYLFRGRVPEGTHRGPHVLSLRGVPKAVLTQDVPRRHVHAGRRRAEM